MFSLEAGERLRESFPLSILGGKQQAAAATSTKHRRLLLLLLLLPLSTAAAADRCFILSDHFQPVLTCVLSPVVEVGEGGEWEE